jgi:predicted nucleic acid-binding protein
VKAYVDASVILRRLLGQSSALKEWKMIRTGVVSRLAEVECLRTLDRLRIGATLDDVRVAGLHEGLYRILASLEIVELSRAVLARASRPTPTSIGTLDAIHLASAQMWRERTGSNLVFATHDSALALGAQASGLSVVGV